MPNEAILNGKNAYEIFKIPNEELPAFVNKVCAGNQYDHDFIFALIELIVHLDYSEQLTMILDTRAKVSLDVVMALALQLNSRKCAEVLMRRNYKISREAVASVVKSGKVRMAYMLSQYLNEEMVQYMLYVAIDYDQPEIVMLLSHIPNHPKVDDTALQLAVVRLGTKRESSSSMTALEILIQSSPEIIKVQQIGNNAVVELTNMISNERQTYCIPDNFNPLAGERRQIEATAL